MEVYLTHSTKMSLKGVDRIDLERGRGSVQGRDSNHVV